MKPARTALTVNLPSALDKVLREFCRRRDMTLQDAAVDALLVHLAPYWREVETAPKPARKPRAERATPRNPLADEQPF